MRNCLFLIISFLVTALNAEEVSKVKAMEIANRFFGTNSRNVKNVAFQFVEMEGESSGKFSTLYILNNVKDVGFVIIAGDDRVTPVLGYSFENNFPQTNIPCNVKMWLEEMDTQIAHISRNNIFNPDTDEEDVGEVIVDLDTPLWGQDKPYNDLCPIIGRDKTPSGCVMTATAIVMRHHQWPEKGVGVVPGYITDTYGYTFAERNLGHIYNWENMPYIYDTYTQEQANNVATLMFDLGMMLEADYVPTGTGAYLSDIPSVLQTYMSYDKSASYYYRNDYSDNEWNKMLRNELDNNRPIIYGGLDRQMSGGHAFVLDGYTTNNYYRVNWGWDGHYNGYFLLSSLEPTGQGTGGNGSNFNYNQSAILGIMKSNVSTERLEFVTEDGGINGFQCSSSSFTVNIPFTISAGRITNLAVTDFTGELMLGLTDGTGKIKEELVTYDVLGLKSGQGYTFANVQCVITKEINKGDRIRAFYRSEPTKEWTFIKGNDDCEYELLVADEYTIDESTNIIFNKEKKVMEIKTKKGVRVVFKNKEGENLSHLCNSVTEGFVVSVDGLERGIYTISLSKGSESRSLKVILGKTKSE